MAKTDIEKQISGKIKSIETDIKNLQEQLKHWQKIASDYETNRTTVESILSLQVAPDLAKGTRKTRAAKAPKLS